MEMLYLLLIIPGLAAIYFGLVLTLRDPRADLRLDFARLKGEPWRFGKDFLWGSATSSHQVEGGCTNNNWYEFESAVDEKGNPRIAGGQKAGLADDQWHLYKEDIKLMKAISLNTYRFSVEWSKVEPEPGRFDEKALDHYEQLVDALIASGVEPMLTLHHFTNPIWFEHQGAFTQDDCPEVFARYVERVVRRLGNKVKLWCTINEPTAYAFGGYYVGMFPPAEKSLQRAAVVLRNLLRCHTAAYKVIKRLAPQAQAGLVIVNLVYEAPGRWNLLDIVFNRLLNKNMTDTHYTYLTEGVYKFSMPGQAYDYYHDADAKDAYDFVGVNYYTRYLWRLKPFAKDKLTIVVKAPPERITDVDWEIYPEGLYRVLKKVGGFTAKPIYITENGLADDSDTKRARFIEEHLLALNKAIAEGADVRGYYYWSLIDNFEWAHGFDKRFGLYHVDYKTQKRTLREGSRKYPEIIAASRA